MNAADGTDKVAVRHVGEGREVGMDASGGGDVTTSSQPLAGFFGVGVRGVFYV